MCIVSINVNDYFGIFTKSNLLKETLNYDVSEVQREVAMDEKYI